MTVVPVSLGQARHAEINHLFAERLARVGTLVIAHRGTAIGSIAENTSAAARAALGSGADVVEIDVTESSDGAFYAFHDGNEQRLLGVSPNLRELSAQQIDSLRYIHVDRRDHPARVEPLLDLLAGLRDSGPAAPLVNIDRSWGSWRTLLPALDELDMPRQLLLKSPAALPEPLEILRGHAVKYPYLPICSSRVQVTGILEDPDLNTVGVELLADAPDHPLADPSFLDELHQQDLCVLVNAEVLPNGRPLFAGFDDERALRQGAEAGWGPLFDRGADLIQTDWPWLLHAYRESRTTCADSEDRP